MPSPLQVQRLPAAFLPLMRKPAVAEAVAEATAVAAEAIWAVALAEVTWVALAAVTSAVSAAVISAALPEVAWEGFAGITSLACAGIISLPAVFTTTAIAARTTPHPSGHTPATTTEKRPHFWKRPRAAFRHPGHP